MCRAWFDTPVRAPTLVLSTTRDQLVKRNHVAEYEKAVRRSGIDLQTRTWTDSGHVKMYKSHPEEYRELVRAFTQKHLKQMNK